MWLRVLLLIISWHFVLHAHNGRDVPLLAEVGNHSVEKLMNFRDLHLQLQLLSCREPHRRGKQTTAIFRGLWTGYFINPPANGWVLRERKWEWLYFFIFFSWSLGHSTIAAIDFRPKRWSCCVCGSVTSGNINQLLSMLLSAVLCHMRACIKPK